MTVRRGPVADGRDREAGSISVFVLGLVVVLMVVAGLVVDGGRAVNGRAGAMDDAEQAARAGANQVDLASLRTGGSASLDGPAARTAAVAYLEARGYESSRISATTTGDAVSVEVTADVPTALLSLILIQSVEVRGTATARAAIGIDQEIPAGAP